MQNGAEIQYKSSQLEKLTNWIILLIFIVQVALCFVIAIGASFWSCNYSKKMSFFIEDRYNNHVEG